MQLGTALLCDAATVREGLINILGGGVARINRESFPAPLGASLALVMMLHRMEQGRPHEIRIIVQGPDGERLAEMEGGFEATVLADADPTEQAAVPLVLPIAGVTLRTPGMHSVDISIDNQHQRSITFRAVQRPSPAAPAP